MKEHKGCEETLGKSETLSVSNQLSYLGARQCSVDNLHHLSSGANGNLILGGVSQYVL